MGQGEEEGGERGEESQVFGGEQTLVRWEPLGGSMFRVLRSLQRTTIPHLDLLLRLPSLVLAFSHIFCARGEVWSSKGGFLSKKW